MKLEVQFSLNNQLFLRDPEKTKTGRKLLKHSILLIHKQGLESFTFKKLAKAATTTEAVVYRYFENKHRLLMYIVSWYWSWLDFRIQYHTRDIVKPAERLQKIIQILAAKVVDDSTTEYIDESLLYEVVMCEGAKAYLTRHVAEDNQHRLFKPYKDLCARIAHNIIEYNPDYPFPHSISNTIVEMSHFQNFFLKNLPSLTDLVVKNKEQRLYSFLEHLVFQTIKPSGKKTVKSTGPVYR